MTPDDESPRAEADLRRRAAERRRLAEVFGDVLPESSRDDLDEPGAGPSEGAEDRQMGRDADLLRDVPPHHGA